MTGATKSADADGTDARGAATRCRRTGEAGARGAANGWTSMAMATDGGGHERWRCRAGEAEKIEELPEDDVVVQVKPKQEELPEDGHVVQVKPKHGQEELPADGYVVQVKPKHGQEELPADGRVAQVKRKLEAPPEHRVVSDLARPALPPTAPKEEAMPAVPPTLTPLLATAQAVAAGEIMTPRAKWAATAANSALDSRPAVA